jgi:hypothetical protein
LYPGLPRGGLAYSPAELPARDYFFQYTWILPGIFNPKINLRGHRYFGGPQKVSAHELAAKAGLDMALRAILGVQPSNPIPSLW